MVDSNLSSLFLRLGILFLFFGLLVQFLPNFHLPGDIFIKGHNYTFYFPIVTSIILSILATIIFNIIAKFH